MKKTRNFNRFFGIAMVASVCCALSSSAVSAAGIATTPTYNGFGYNASVVEARTQTGASSIHDSDMMRYDKNSRIKEMDYREYEKAKYGTGGEAVTNYAAPNDNYMKATIDEMGSKGVYINSIEVSPSEILTRDEINSVIGKYVGKNVFMSDIQEAINALNKLYAEKGYVTARAYLPEQTVTNGNIKVELIESKIGNVTVVNNKYTTSGYILKRMPEKSGQLFDIVDLERDVLDFNRYHDGVNLQANLKAGQQPGTTDIELTAQETFPFHLIGMMDNAGRRSTGQLRGGPAIVVDSLFHHRDQMSLGAYFSRGATSPFFDYSVPINKKDGRIGFSFSSTFAQKIKSENALVNALGLKANSYIYSLYYDQPIIRKQGIEFKTYAALNYKRSRTWFSNDDFSMLRPYIEDKDEVTSIDAGFNLRKDTKYGIWYFNQMASMAVPIFDSESSYFKYSGGLLRLHDFSHGFIGQLRSSYQVIPNSKHIPYMDLFQTGGLATVRGYSEGLLMGKNGYYVSAELMFPLLPRTITTKSGTHNFIGNYLKGAVFADTAGVFPWNGEDYMGSHLYGMNHDGCYFLASIGMGLRVQLPGDLSARLYWGYPLINNEYENHRHMGRFHFELTLEPDLDSLLARRAKKVQPAPAPAPEPQPQPEPEPELPPLDLPNNYDDVRHYDYLLDGSATSL